jgi:GntR family transcriptional regulator
MPRYPYQKVADDLRGRIRTGTYPPGSRIPSRTQLCKEFNVSDLVIGKAMMVLRAEGLVETLPGVAVYVTDPVPDEPAEQ